MIPYELKTKIERQPGKVYRSNQPSVSEALFELDITPESEFAEFFRAYVITFFDSDVSDEQLCDLLEPNKEILAGTNFVREVSNLPDRHICLTTVQGEGAYLYDKDTGTVFEVDLAKRDEFLIGAISRTWGASSNS
ncbi:hypothetical protein [Herbaspirillum huttiense]|uniref:hypothetical protein n=1 Tax=Herbaspirillum huttiense TaxID=863372 RepID=UPI0031D11BD6